MVISLEEVSKVFERAHPLELSFVSYNIIEEIKRRASEACQSLAPKSKNLPNGGVTQEHVPLAFESITWALTGYETVTRFESAIFNDKNVQKSLALVERICKRDPERFLRIADEWKNIVIKRAKNLYRQGNLDNIVTFEISNQFYLDSRSTKRLLNSIK